MGREKTKNNDLPPRMFARKGKKLTTYYYVTTGSASRKWINLGRDKNEALKQWAALEQGKNLNPNTFEEIAAIYENEEIPKKAPATQKDYLRELKKLLPVFGTMPIDQIQPHHIKRYLNLRTGKVRANREKALVSCIFNFARENGYTNVSNPCIGVKGNKELGRDRYIEDTEYVLLWNKSNETLKDILDLLLFTGQRPADVRKMTTGDIKDNAIWVKQGKTGAKLGIEIINEFKIIMERILNRKKNVRSIYLISDINGQPLSQWTIRTWFDKAREDSGINFQMRDLRAKNATDAKNIELAKKRLGHSTTQMTEKYIRSRKGEKVPPLK